ncbi:MAG: glycoside hydrolase family 2 TIM barrel-domain containing protein [Actinomycetes bacterium]
MNNVSEVADNWSLSLSPSPDYLPTSIPATVPGCIHTDLIRAGLIADISVDGREVDQMWIWKTNSVYRTTLKQSRKKSHASLKFYGLDTIASIYVNNNLAISTKNMHRSYELEISDQLRAGDVQLEIHFKAPLTDAEEQVEELGLYPRPYDMPYNYQRKMACSYGWDWGPVTISSGIWKKVELVEWDSAYLSSVAILPFVESGLPTLMIRPIVKGDAANLQIQVQVKENGSTFETAVFAADLEKYQFTLPTAKLWQPRGRGEQQLYTVEVSLLCGEEILQVESKRIGFRTIELDTSAINSLEYPDKHRFAIKVNGLRLWIRGANWIPDDPFPTRVTRERYEQRIKDMLEVNINGIRVWGGGIYESEDFYNFCDQEGIVVWQDFLFACAAYPETPEMFAEVALEAEEAVRRLENHPSLVIWCGGNECIEGFQHWGWQELLAGRPWGETLYRQTIPEVIQKLDGTRPYIPGSPFSTHHEDVKSFESGTNHIWDVWNELGYERYEQYTPSFAAEFGFNGPGSWSMLTRAIGKDNLDSNDVDVATHQKAFNGMAKVAAGLAREFAHPPTSGVAWYFAAALDQARAVEVGLKHFRSLYEVCSGAILWQFNDMWPAISWAVLDYTGFRKLAWHAMKAAYQPRTIAIGRVDQGAELTIINDTQNEWRSSAAVTLIDRTGEIVAESKIDFMIGAFGVSRTALAEIFPQIASLTFEGFLLARTDGVRAARRTTLQPAKAAPMHELKVKSQFVDGHLEVDVVAINYLHELSLLSEVVDLGTRVDSQIVSLLPGETHTFIVSGRLETLEKVQSQLEELLWSHNRVVATK